MSINKRNNDMTNIEEIARRIDNMESTIAGLKDALTRLRKDETTQTPVYTKESNLTSRERAKIEDIMENFDFQKVHDVMEQLDWKWAMSKNGVPTIDEMKHEAKRLLIDACVERTCVATGGFRAVYEDDEPGGTDPYIGLEFIVEECEGFVDDDEDEDGIEKDPAPWARGGAAE